MFFTELVRLQIDLWNAVDARLKADHAVPLASYEFLRIIHTRGGCRVGDIAEDLSITVGGTSKLVDRLETGGFVLRRSNPDDRRSSIIDLTESGHSAFGLARSIVADELHRRLGSTLPHAELDRLTATLVLLRGSVRNTESPSTASDERISR